MTRTLVSRVLLTGAVLLALGSGSQPAAQQLSGPKSSDEKAVRIMYLPGLSNERKLADPFSATYSTVYLLQGEGGNSVTFESDSGIVVINTMTNGWGGPILEMLNLISEEPVTTIVNTHPDADYTGSNGEFPDAVTIVAHANAKTAMEKMPAFQGANAKFLPNKTFTESLSLFEGRNTVELFYFGAGHTNGDSVAVIPTYAAAYLGELFPGKATPVIDTKNGGSAVALPDTLARALEKLVELRVETLVLGKAVPAGAKPVRPVTGLKDLQEYVDFNRAFLAAAKAALEAGKSVDEAAASLGLPDRFKDYGMDHAKANVQAIYDELQR